MPAIPLSPRAMPVRLAVAAMLVWLCLWSALAPLTAHAQSADVVASGTATVPRRSAAWRVVRRDVPTLAADARAFVLPEAAPLTVAWPEGRQETLDPGEAAWVGPNGAQATGADGSYAPFLTIELAPAGFASGPTGAGVLAVGTPFTAPDGDRTLEVLSGTLAEGEAATLDPGATPGILVVTAGSVEVRGAHGADMVQAGAAATVDGRADAVNAGGGPATWYLARVGAATPATPTPAPTAGAVAVTLYDCPADVPPGEASAERCAFTAGPVLDLALAPADGSVVLPLAAATRVDERLVWEALPFGDWTLRAASLAPGYAAYLVPGVPALGTPVPSGDGVQTGAGYQFRVDADTPALDLPVYVFRDPATASPEPSGGSIGVTVHACPPGMRPLALDPEACPPGPAADLELFLLGTGAGQRSAEDATRDGDRLVWDGLADGTWVVKVDRFAVGFDRYKVPGGSGLNAPDDDGYTAGPNEGYLVTLGPGAARADLDLYVFRAAVPGADGFALGVRVWQCPPGVAAADDMRSLGCTAVAARPPGPDLAVSGAEVSDPPRLAAATPAAGGTVPLGTLPGGEYQLTATLPPATTGYALRSTDPRATVDLLPSRTGYLLNLGASSDSGAGGEVVLDLYLLN